MLCTPLQSRKVLKHALENHYAILAVNADSHAALYDCLEAALRANAPIIIETSLWQLKGYSFGAGDPIMGMARYISNLALLANSERFSSIPVMYHTDHIKGSETMRILTAAIEGIPFKNHEESLSLRASTISLDASEFSEEENIKHIIELCAIAKSKHVAITLEMESAVDEGITSFQEAEKLLGSVEEKFPDHIYLWAPGVGTQHGFGETMSFTADTVAMHSEYTRRITGRTIGIALHGSTGLSHADLSAAAKAGVIKVNWSTESLLIRSEAAREYYKEGEKFNKANSEWKNTVMDNGVNTFISKMYLPKVMDRIKILGGEGKALPIYQTLVNPSVETQLQYK